MSVWSGTIPQGRAPRAPRWLRLVLALLISALHIDPPAEEPQPQQGDGPDDNWGGWRSR